MNLTYQTFQFRSIALTFEIHKLKVKKEKKIIDYCSRTDVSQVVSLNDLEEKEYNGQMLSQEEEKALTIFRKIRLQRLLKKAGSEVKFHENYEYLRAVKNVVDYRDFLNENGKDA